MIEFWIKGLLGILTLGFPLMAAEAVSEPVGGVVMKILGTAGAGEKLSFISPGLANPVVAQGKISAISGATLTDSVAGWGEDQYNGASGVYYVEIVSGAQAGWITEVIDTVATSKSLILADSLVGLAQVGDSYRVRKATTLGQLLGASNEAGLLGGTATTSDQVLVWNGSGYDTYYYKTSGLGGTGWRKTGDSSTNQAGVVIPPERGVMIRRLGVTNLEVAVSGSVKTGVSQHPLGSGMNLVANSTPKDLKLGESGLYTGNGATGLNGGTAATADQVLVWNGSGYETYYYKTSGLGGTGWRKTGDSTTDQSQAVIPANVAFILKRNGSAFVWVQPAVL